MRSISGLSKNWLKDIERVLNKYLNAVKWEINEVKTLEYIKKLQSQYSNCGYRKIVYQIRKFLQHLKIDFANSIQPPKEQEYTPVRITSEDIKKTLDYFKEHERELQLTALIHLGKDSGSRAEELYQLQPEDIEIVNRVLRINHNPDNEQTTKNKKSRISFFTEHTAQMLKEYIEYYDNGTCLFSERAIQNAFSNAPIKVKDLRKFFSQEWDRRGGPTSIKKILMGHSLRRDVDLMHYNCQSEEDLKRIYDQIMSHG